MYLSQHTPRQLIFSLQLRTVRENMVRFFFQAILNGLPMPEGPEIRIAADKVFAAIGGKPLEKVWFEFPRLKCYEQRLIGQHVKSVETRGKAMLTHFSNELSLYSHNQLYGVWIIQPRGSLPKTNRALRLALHNNSKSTLLYSATDIEIHASQTLENHPFLCKLGPDILNPDLTIEMVLNRLRSKSFKRRSLGSIYLDQSFLAGLGNYLRSEILHVAGLNPYDNACNLNESKLYRVSLQTLEIAKRSYTNKGVIVDSKTAAILKNSGHSYSQYRFWVFSREHEPCRVCASPIRKIIHSGRNLFYCETCQPRVT
jgi:endonuclease-8